MSLGLGRTFIGAIAKVTADMSEGLTITGITGNEAWGSYKGSPWYLELRANGAWFFSLSEDMAVDPANVDGPLPGFFLNGRYGSRHNLMVGMEMDYADMEALIRDCVEQYQGSIQETP